MRLTEKAVSSSAKLALAVSGDGLKWGLATKRWRRSLVQKARGPQTAGRASSIQGDEGWQGQAGDNVLEVGPPREDGRSWDGQQGGL